MTKRAIILWGQHSYEFLLGALMREIISRSVWRRKSEPQLDIPLIFEMYSEELNLTVAFLLPAYRMNIFELNRRTV